MGLPFFIIARALGKATTFSLGWATSLFFGQIPGGKERVVSMLSAISFAWLLITYVGGGFAATILLLHATGHVALDDPVIGDGRMQAVALGIVLLPPLLTYIAEKSDLTEEFSLVRWLKHLPRSYPIALSLGAGVALMLVIGPIVLLRRSRTGKRTHHIPVLVAEGRFSELVDDIADELEQVTGTTPVIGGLGGLWAIPMRAMHYAGERLFGSIVRDHPVLVVAGGFEVAAHATDVNVTAPAKDAYWLRAALYKRFGLGRMYLTWSADTQAFERRLWKLHLDVGASKADRLQRLDRLENAIDRAAIGSDEWNVLYRVVLQLREELKASRAERSA
ncbi:MAG TPA: hypothetical protein VL493_02985 [Candidatus Saccharimonadales bacterium]|nr:hypothetical protein [Candidatus Saccharimonadales bacterium]